MNRWGVGMTVLSMYTHTPSPQMLTTTFMKIPVCMKLIERKMNGKLVSYLFLYFVYIISEYMILLLFQWQVGMTGISSNHQIINPHPQYSRKKEGGRSQARKKTNRQ